MKKQIAIITCCLLAACSDSGVRNTDPTPDRVTAVTVATPEVREVSVVLKALGTVESIQRPTVAAETSGRVIKLLASEGDAVQADDVLVQLDNTLHNIETARALAELKRQDAMVQNQINEVDRLKKLAKTQAVSADQLEDQQTQLEVLKGQRDVALKEWEKETYMASKTAVNAPLSGLVTRRYISIGDYLTVGQPLFDMVSTDILRARLSFPEHNTAMIQVGKEVLLDSPSAPGIQAKGTVTSINPQIEAGNRALEVIVDFVNPGEWLPGSSVDATLFVERRPEALTVPGLSMTVRDGENVVFVKIGDKASARIVEPGWRETDWVEILEGIDADELIIVEGAALISDGSPITARAPRQ